MKVLLLGTANAPYHPLPEVAEELKKILGNEICLTVKDDPAALKEVGEYDLFINYLEFGGSYDDEQTAALLSYIANGGKMLAIHNAIAMAVRPELRQLLGGRFAGHPAYETLPHIPFRPVEGSALCEDVEPFCLYDEEYTFAMEEDGKEIFLEMEAYGKIIPAGWRKNYGKGKLIFLACGHNGECFRADGLIKLVCNAVKALSA